MKEKLTIEEYGKIEHLVDCALDAPNKKEAQKYINQMQSYENNLCGNARNIMGELYLLTKLTAVLVAMNQVMWYSVFIVQLRNVKVFNVKFMAGEVKSRRCTRGTFMSAFSNESSSHEVCAEGTSPFSAVAQRL